MGHGLILGQTESGKTTLAKRMAQDLKSKQVGILVLDPIKDPAWNADFITDDPHEFLNVFWESRSCVVFIDEAGENVGNFDEEMKKTATRGRHWGHSCFYIAQRGTLIARTVRDQCSVMYLFNSGREDCKVHAQEWNCDELMSANLLQKGEFYHVTRFSGAKKCRLF